MDQCILLSFVNIVEGDPYDDDIPFVLYHDLGIVVPSTRDEINYDVVTSILIYNTAPAHQLYAQQLLDTVTSHQYLQRSKNLYGLAMDAYADVDHNVLFQFAVMNNIAVIELETGNAALSRYRIEDLISTLMLLLDQGYRRSSFCYLVRFLRNDPFQLAAAASA